MRGKEGSKRRAADGSIGQMEVRELEDKKRDLEGGGCEGESSDGVIALQRSSDKQHLRASVVK